MNTDGQSRHFRQFWLGIDVISSQVHTDDFHNKLYFSQVVCLMEKYLSDVFVDEISNNRERLLRLAEHNKFRQHKLALPYILNHDIEAYLINSVKNMVWHRLNDIENLYKHVLSIDMNIQQALLDKLKIRHDIVHRNGHTLNNERIEIGSEDLASCMFEFTNFVKDIDDKYVRLCD